MDGDATKQSRYRPKSIAPSGQDVLGNRFKVSYDHILGEGSFARVCKGLDRQTNKEVAVKIYKVDPGDSEFDFAIRHFQENITTMQAIMQPGIRAPEKPEVVVEPKRKWGSKKKKSQEAPPKAHRGSFMCELIEHDICQTAAIEKNWTTDENGLAVHPDSPLNKIDTVCCFVRLLAHSEQSNMPGLDMESEKLWLAFEMGTQSLEERLEEHAAQGTMLPAEELRQVQWSLVSMVCGLHAAGYVHMDLKPANIVRFGKIWKLIDFDGAVKTGTVISLKEMCISPCYMPPEIAKMLIDERKEMQVSRLMDVWSIGLCAMEAIFMQPVMRPWYTEWFEETGSERKYLEWLSDFEAKPDLFADDMTEAMRQIDPDMSELLQGMLTKDPNKRMDIAQCLIHPWFSDIRSRAWSDKFSVEDLENGERRRSWLSGTSTQNTAKVCTMM